MKMLENKIISLGVLSLIIGVVAYYLGARTGKGKSQNNAEDELQKEISKNPLTYEKTQYSAFADNLFSAMDGMGTDEDSIYSVFSKLRNRSDVLQLIKSFGTRSGSNLNVWITDELELDELSHLNDILLRNNINYQF